MDRSVQTSCHQACLFSTIRTLLVRYQLIIYQKIGFISTWYYQWYLGCFILHFVRYADVCWSCFRPCVQPKEPSYSSRWRRSAWHLSLHPTRPRCYHPPVERKQVKNMCGMCICTFFTSDFLSPNLLRGYLTNPKTNLKNTSRTQIKMFLLTRAR